MLNRIYRRRIRMNVGPQVVEAALEDDFHHFRLSLRHDGTAVTAVSSESLRHPWTICPGAGGPLQALVGQPLTSDAAQRDLDLDRHHQCTHLLELALLAVAQTARGESRQYDVTISDPDPEMLDVRLDQNGREVEHWSVAGDYIQAPKSVAGLSLRASRRWSQALGDDEAYERISILRRCIQVAGAWGHATAPGTAAEIPAALNACFAFQTVRVGEAVYKANSARDFSDAPTALLGAERDPSDVASKRSRRAGIFQG